MTINDKARPLPHRKHWTQMSRDRWVMWAPSGRKYEVTDSDAGLEVSCNDGWSKSVPGRLLRYAGNEAEEREAELVAGEPPPHKGWVTGPRLEAAKTFLDDVAALQEREFDLLERLRKTEGKLHFARTASATWKKSARQWREDWVAVNEDNNGAHCKLNSFTEQVRNLVARNKKLTGDLEDQRSLALTRTRERDQARDEADDWRAEAARRTVSMTEEIRELQAEVADRKSESVKLQNQAADDSKSLKLYSCRISQLNKYTDELERKNAALKVGLACMAVALVVVCVLPALEGA